MSILKYRNQVELLLDVLPEIAQVNCFAMHGGTVINLFVRDMPRLSVDIDLTYLPIEDRDSTLMNIERALRVLRERIQSRFPTTRVTEPFENPGQAKLFCLRQGVQSELPTLTFGTVSASQLNGNCLRHGRFPSSLWSYIPSLGRSASP